jgi:hypothetical protein
MFLSRSPHGRARLIRTCALALVRLWTWILLFGAVALLLSACGGGGGGGSSPPSPTPPAANSPPVSNAGVDQLVLTGTAVTISGAGTDSDGSIASYAWVQTSGTTVTLGGANSATLTFTAPATAAALVFDLTVTDNLGLARTDSVTVNVNAPPVAAAGADQNVMSGANVSLGGSGTDANGSIATYAWTQTAGAAVTLSGASGAAATFTAPMTASTLEFRLTVTDNQGATHFDTIAVTVRVMAAPVIAHHPTNVRAHEKASALFFVHASGENLSYEWIGAGGVVVKGASPEPFYQRGTSAGLDMSSDGNCYRVVVSNSAGSVTSEPGCLEVMPLVGDFDPADDDQLDDYYLAEAYGNANLRIIQNGAGMITNGGGLSNRSSVPRLVGPRQNCLGGGEFTGSALDGQVLTQGTTLPLGQHTLSMIWRECGNGDVDEPSDQVGGVMIRYDFPNVFGVGSYTLYFSGFGEDWMVLNGILRTSISRDVSASGWPLDQVLITLEDDFSVAQLRCECLYEPEIEMTRRLNMDETLITDAKLDFDGVSFSIYDEDNFIGYMSPRASASSIDIDLHYDPTVGDSGVPAHTSEGQIGVALGTSFGSGDYLLGIIVAARGTGGGDGWQFSFVPPEDPED